MTEEVLRPPPAAIVATKRRKPRAAVEKKSVSVPRWLDLAKMQETLPQELLEPRAYDAPLPTGLFVSGENPRAPTVFVIGEGGGAPAAKPKAPECKISRDE